MMIMIVIVLMLMLIVDVDVDGNNDRDHDNDNDDLWALTNVRPDIGPHITGQDEPDEGPSGCSSG